MNRKTTLILLSVLILLGLYTWWLQASPPSPAAPTPAPAAKTKVWEFAADQVAGFQVTDSASGQSVGVSKNALGQWNVMKPETKPADPNQINLLTASLSNLSYSANITSTTDLAPFGLASPTLALQVDLANGTSLKAAIGDKIPVGSGYYMLRAGESIPLVVDDYGLQSLVDLLTTPPYFVPTPEVTP